MKTYHFDVTIDAPREAVWETMLNQDTYREWTEAFMPGSYYEGSWNEGEKIRFLAPDGNGMLGEIAESRPNEFVSIRHVGIINEGVEDTESDEARRWAPAYENYTLSDMGSSTKVEIEVDVAPEYEKEMVEAWPKALDRLKEISESRAD